MRIMGKPSKGTGKRRGNSPYKKYGKREVDYGTDYKKNYLVNGILHRDGKPYFFRKQDAERLQAAE
jgi:hypothetical protein